jgi:hypothetical protein
MTGMEKEPNRKKASVEADVPVRGSSQGRQPDVSRSRSMIITTTENIPEARVVKTSGQVFGLTVRSRSLGATSPPS